MVLIALLLIALIWGIGTGLRVYRQARYYQIDEYKIGRYLRWWFAKRDRLFPQRPTLTGIIGVILTVFFSEGGAIFPAVIAIIAGLIAVYPPSLGEVKKKFRATQRAQRLLGTAFVLVALEIVGSVWLITAFIEDEALQVTGIMALGWLIFLLAPLYLMIANVLMMPVESAFRRRFIGQARGVMHAVNPTVIGITGSYGKTTTKNYINDILNGRYKSYATPKSYNTMMGICLAINNDLSDNYAVDYFVVEMGAYIEGEIARICDLTPPKIGVMVEVGPQHLERFGSLDVTAKAKYELIKALPKDGLGVFNWDNEYIREMYERGYPDNRIAISKTLDPQNLPDNPPRLIASHITETLNSLTFAVTDTQTGENQLFETSLLGEHNVTNLLLATAVALYEGMTLQDIAFQVKRLQPAESRLVRQQTTAGITIINDAYSANPSGIISALKVLGMHQTGKRLLITPGMIELAHLHEPENKKLGIEAAKYATDVILVGEEQTRPIKAGLDEVGFASERVKIFETLTEAINWYQSNLSAGDTVLFLNDLPDTY